MLMKSALGLEGAAAVNACDVVSSRVAQVLLECVLGLKGAIAVFTLKLVGGRVA